jgi:hypothetical protein
MPPISYIRSRKTVRATYNVIVAVSSAPRIVAQIAAKAEAGRPEERIRRRRRASGLASAALSWDSENPVSAGANGLLGHEQRQHPSQPCPGDRVPMQSLRSAITRAGAVSWTAVAALAEPCLALGEVPKSLCPRDPPSAWRGLATRVRRRSSVTHNRHVRRRPTACCSAWKRAARDGTTGCVALKLNWQAACINDLCLAPLSLGMAVPTASKSGSVVSDARFLGLQSFAISRFANVYPIL